MAVIAAERVGYALDVDLACAGAVHSVFSRAVNLEIEGEMWTLLASDCADLPFGIRLPVRSFEAFAIREGDCVHARGGFLGAGRSDRRIVADCRAAPRWTPSSPSAIAPGFEARLALLSQAATARAWFGSREMAGAATRSLLRVCFKTNEPHPEAPFAEAKGLEGCSGGRLRRHPRPWIVLRGPFKAPQDEGGGFLKQILSGRRLLDDTLAGIVGRGPGLTPAGDDVLVGILAVLSSPLAGDAGAQAAQAMRPAVGRLTSRTTAVSAHMLCQAARGLFGRMPLDLVGALAGGSADELDCALRSIAATGATSGGDVCVGVLEAAQAFLRSGAYKAAA